MVASLPHLTKEEADVLFTLWDDAVADQGWLRHGVRGWLFLSEIEFLLNRMVDEELDRLCDLGFIERITVARSGRRDRGLYRITAAGASLIDPEWALPVRQADAGKTSFFLSKYEWTTLLVYRTAASDKTLPPRFGKRGWLTAAEARSRGEADCTAAANLARMGFIERRRDETAGNRPLYSRVTPSGAKLNVVDQCWVGSPSIARIEVDVG